MTLNLTNRQLYNLDNINIDNNVEILNLSYNNLTKIPDKLKKLNNLRELYIDGNIISEIKNLPDNLIVLSINYNYISDLSNLPLNLEMLYIADNQISNIKNLPNGLKELWIDNNNINNLEGLPIGIKKLDISDNQISEIKNIPDTLERLDIYNNHISELPLRLLEFRYLNEINYYNNPIEFIPELIQRWLDRINNRITDNNHIYNDQQNIHNHNIQKSFRNSLSNIIKDQDLIDMDTIINDLTNNQILNEQSKTEIFNYFDDNIKHSIYDISYKELFRYVYSRILKHQYKDDILNILNSEIKDGICLCFTGRLTRLLNCLVGYYDDIDIQISDSEQITNIITNLRIKYDDEELKDKVREELKERDYNDDIIEEWISYI